MNIILNLIISAVLGFLISALLGIVLVPALHKLKFGQTILDIGPNWHKNKQGTPTMGGIMFIISTIITTIAVILLNKALGLDVVAQYQDVLANSTKVKLYAGMILALGFGIIGFADDYIKVVKKQNEGLTVIQKTLCQLALSAAYIVTLCLIGDQYMYIPFVGNIGYGSPIIFAIFTVIVIYATVNAVNFTDGIDGLCASVTVTAAFSFAVMAVLHHFIGASILACALLGACAGYLIWNWHPAKCFMGDTGSMFLGGMIVALAYAIDCPLILLVAGFVYVIEGLSDVIQIGYFKITKKIARRTDPNATGKRLFKMAPIHHHFEKCGWSEVKIVLIFSLVNLIAGAIACLLIYFG
ncbi:MAG: phospho-N-acetylmuramoyl-pentapeptide-transferase [Oscillospiraceae bacterium]|nr:phospho-N-acetylmuramoyl-pentapeptide-transferase [Candidatus Limimonas coprohippi]